MTQTEDEPNAQTYCPKADTESKGENPRTRQHVLKEWIEKKLGPTQQNKTCQKQIQNRLLQTSTKHNKPKQISTNQKRPLQP